MILLILHSLHIWATGLSCSDTVYQNKLIIKVIMTNLIGFWSQSRPYQDIVEVNDVGDPLQ